MPSIFKMSTSDEKKTEASGDSTFVIAESSPAVKARPTAQYVIIAVSVIVTIAMVLTAILVGMYMFTQAEQAMIKYTLDIGPNGKQHVTSDPNENIVQYHVSTDSGENWIVNDFNREIQMMKMTGSDGITNCFVTPLNKSEALSPSEITGPESNEVITTVPLRYSRAESPVTDISFLGQTAQTMCSGFSVYWLYPYCSGAATNNMPATNKTALLARKKRTTYCPADVDNSPYKILTYDVYNYNSVEYCIPCYVGCCAVICSWSVSINAYISGGSMYCSWAFSQNVTINLYGPYIDTCTMKPTGLVCAPCQSEY